MLGGEAGLLTGSAGARRSLMRDPESRGRIERAVRGYRVDVLRREIEEVRGEGLPGIL